MIKKTTLPRLFVLCFMVLFSFFVKAQDVFINEIHYDNASADVDEGIEIAGVSGTDLTGWSLVLYNGNNGAEYNTVSLVGIVPDVENGYGFIFTFISGIQNGGPDGIALVNTASEVVQFLSYEGSFIAIDGPANGLTSEDIGVSEASSTLDGFSLQLSGEGTTYSDFTWEAPAESTFEDVNNNQIFGTPVPNVFINEIHYDNTGADADETVEIAGEAGVDLTGWTLVLYNGSNGTTYNTHTFSETITDSGSGFGFIAISFSQIQNGGPDGIALVNAEGETIQFLSYEGSFTATNGPANGLTSDDIGVSEASNTPTGLSLQLTGEGFNYSDFTWAEASTSTYGAVNNDQIIGEPISNVFINEFHYDNSSTDSDETIELAGEAGNDINGWSLVLYNGSNGESYNTASLSGVFSNTSDGFGFISFPFSSIQNGPDAIALVNNTGEVIQFISYEGSFTAVGGPADGLVSEDIGISEGSSTPIGNSLQLTGVGSKYEDFSWSAIPSTFDALNTGQSFGDVIDPIELTFIADARLLPLLTRVKIQGILTASDQLGGPAFIEDETGGIAVFDESVHGTGTFQIGDELEIVGSVSEFRQMIQIGSVTDVVKLSEGNSVVPTTTTISELSTLEGQLVFVDNITFDVAGRLATGNHFVSDATGSVETRIDNDVESLIGRVKPDTATTLTGVVGSFEGTLQVFPRFEPDLPGTEEFVLEPPAGSDIPKEETLDVATWNMEFFGSTLSGFGPSDIQLQKENALRVIDSLNADIIAVQEVSDVDFLAAALSEHTTADYGVICSDVYSYSFEPDDGTFPKQQLCFIYNKNTVSIIDDKVVFDEFYTAARTGLTSDLDDYPTGNPRSFWSSGRLPYLITAEVNIQGAIETISLINVHAKSGPSASDVARKEYDFEMLKDTLDTQYNDQKLVLLGDYNDDVDISIGGGTTPLLPFVTDVSNYDIVSSSFSEDGQSSTVGFQDVIDHTTITNELFEPYIEDSEFLLDPRDFITNYGNTTSDHFPSVTRFILEVAVEPLVLNLPENITLYEGIDGLSTAIITPEVTGGVEPYTFEWSTGDTEAEIEVSSANEGYILLTVSDENASSVQDSIQVLTIDALTVDGIPESIKLYDGYEKLSAAAINVNALGGEAPYTFEWSNGKIGQEIEVTTDDEGELTLTVTDTSGLYIVTQSIQIEVEDVSCSNKWYTGVQMCYRGRTYCIAEYWVDHFISKGYVIGSCDDDVTQKRYIKALNNPFYNNLKLGFYFENASSVNISIVNYYGHAVFNTNLNVAEDWSVQTLNLSHLHRGFYIVKITDNNDPDYRKIIRVYKKR